jgi:putative transcriptional regulator
MHGQRAGPAGIPDEAESVTPTPEAIRETRQQAGLSQTAAAALIHSTLRTWQDWEAGKAKMHPGLWELFLIKTKDKQHGK